MIPKLVDGIDVSEQAQAMDALRETGPGQHFLGSAHTQANFEDAFWRSEMADNTTYEQWSSEGSIDSAGRALKKFADMLESYVAPEIDPAVDEALRGFIAKRMEELPDADY
jgi:trimethylamine--corrinoid protein Co-methyltransferase